jgi:hypothetical protein
LTDGASETVDSAIKASVFISYARDDAAFADRLVAALKERGFEAFIDRGDIAPGDLWSERLKSLITQAHAIVFVISPDAVESRACKDEFEFATGLNKRLVPIVCRRVSAGKVPQQLKERHWIFFDDPAHFSRSIEELSETLESDIDWLRRQAHFTGFAQLWDAAKRPGPAVYCCVLHC